MHTWRRQIRNGGEKAWLLSGTSEKPHHAWLIPPGVLGNAVVSDIMKGLESLNHHKQLRGSDDGDHDDILSRAILLLHRDSA